MTLDQIERFRDGAIGQAEREAGRRLAAAIRHREERLRHCRIGRVIDRRPVPERMGQVMARCYRARGSCTAADLLEAGFTHDEMRQHAMLARGVAARLVDRQLDGD